MIRDELKPVAWQFRYRSLSGWTPWKECSQRDYGLLTGLREHETRALVPAPTDEDVRRIADSLARLSSWASNQLSAYGDYQTYDAITQEVAAIREAMGGEK